MNKESNDNLVIQETKSFVRVIDLNKKGSKGKGQIVTVLNRSSQLIVGMQKYREMLEPYLDENKNG